MTTRIGFGAEKIPLLALRWSKISSVLMIVLLAFIFYSLSNLKFDQEINRVFLSDSPISTMQREYEAAQDPPRKVLVAYVSSDAPFTAEQMMALRNISLDLEFVDGVIGVGSPFIVRMPPQADAPLGVPVFPVDIPEDYDSLLDDFRGLQTGLPTYITADRKSLLMTVSIDLNQTDFATALPQAQAEFDRSLPEGVSARLTGEEAISLEIVTGVKSDLYKLNILGGIMVALGAWLLLRDFRMTVLTVIPSICGAASVLALSVWLGYPITVLSDVVPILLLVLGVANAVHLARHMKNNQCLVADTFRDIGPACALTAITTSVAFASLMITDNVQVYEFAVLGTLGTALAFTVSTTVFALMANVIHPEPGTPITSASGFARWLTSLGEHRPRTVIVLGLLLLAISTVGYMRTEPWFELQQNLPRNSETRITNDAVSDNFGGVFQMILEIDNDWEKTQRLTDDLTAIAGSEAVLSEASLARWLGTADQQPTAEQLELLPAAVLESLRPSENVQRIFVQMSEPMRSDEALAKYKELYAVASTDGANRIFGLPVVMREEAIHLIAQLSRSLVVASLGATFVVALAFRSFSMIPILLAVNVLPLMVTGAALHIFADGKLNPTAILALTIAFGIAIDDTVHFLSRFNKARGEGDSIDASMVRATRSAGQAMVLTTTLLTIGLSVTLISDFGPIRLFGGMILTILWSALLTDLLLLPALLTLKDRKR